MITIFNPQCTSCYKQQYNGINTAFHVLRYCFSWTKVINFALSARSRYAVCFFFFFVVGIFLDVS